MAHYNSEKVDRTCLVYVTQALNALTIACLVASAIVRFTIFAKDSRPSDPFFYILTIYLVPFAALLAIAELKYLSVLKYFEFLGYNYGRGIFMIFVALLLFDTNYPVDTTVSIFMTLVGLFNVTLTCVAPDLHRENVSLFKREQEKCATETESEDMSENETNDHDNLLPRTYAAAASRHNASNKPQKSTAH